MIGKSAERSKVKSGIQNYVENDRSVGGSRASSQRGQEESIRVSS